MMTPPAVLEPLEAASSNHPTTQSAIGAMSAGEFASLSGADELELIDGTPVKRPTMGARSQFVAARIAAKLVSYGDDAARGFGFGDGTPFAFGAEGRQVLKPDAAFVAAERLAEVPVANVPVAPDFVVEVISPSDRAIAVQDKVARYFEGGVRIALLAYPTTHELHVVRPDRTIEVFGPGDTLVAADVLPDFSLSIDDLFARLPLSADPADM